jgi:hypothetical protein
MNKISAFKAAEFSKAISIDAKGRVREVAVPGHDGARYEVIIKRDEKGHDVKCECRQALADGNYIECEGNEFNTCYHSIVAIMIAAGVMGKQVAFSANKQGADKTARFHKGSKVVKFGSNRNDKRIYAVTF